MTTLLIDDEMPARILLRQYLAEFPQLHIIGECADGPAAVAAICSLQPDLVFLDIQMPGCTGFEVLAQLDRVPPVIFSTAYDQHALRAFDTGAIDYLLKPFGRARFRQAVARVLARPHAPSEALQNLLDKLMAERAGPAAGLPETAGPAPYPARLFVPQGTRLVAVAVADIRFATAAGDYTTLHTPTGQRMSNLGISQLAQRLDPRQFLRVHRSIIVALDAVRELERDGSGGYYATLEGGHVVRVSRSYAEVLRPLLG